MPGTPEEYMAGGGFSQAADMITQQIESGVTDGNQILEALESSGMRLYTADEMGEEPMGEDPMAGMEEGDVEAGGLPPMEDEEAGFAGPPPEAGGEGPSMVGGSAGRDDLMDAVRFGMEEDMKKKSKHKEEMGGY